MDFGHSVGSFSWVEDCWQSLPSEEGGGWRILGFATALAPSGKESVSLMGFEVVLSLR